MVQLAPLNPDRLQAALDRKAFSYHRTEEDRFEGSWNDVLMKLSCVGSKQEMLVVSGMWKPDPPNAFRAELLDKINQWSTTNWLPKAYLQPKRDSSGYFVITDYCIDLEMEVTDSQLDYFLMVGIRTSIEFFRWLEQQFPQFRDWLLDGQTYDSDSEDDAEDDAKDA